MLLPFLALLYLCGAAPTLVPIAVTRSPSGALAVTLQAVDMALRSQDPARYPMFHDLMSASGGSARARMVSMTELKSHLDSSSGTRGRGLWGEGEEGDYPPAIPSGFVFHEARVGSTLAANSK